MTFFKNEGAIK